MFTSMIGIVGYHELTHKQIIDMYGGSSHYIFSYTSVGVQEDGYTCRLNPDCMKLQGLTEIVGYTTLGGVILLWCLLLAFIIFREHE